MRVQVSYSDLLEVKLYDSDKFSGDDPLGMVEIRVSDMAAAPKVHPVQSPACPMRPCSLACICESD